jgi:hypothetical protein
VNCDFTAHGFTKQMVGFMVSRLHGDESVAPALNDSLLCCVGHQEAHLPTKHETCTAYVKAMEETF